MLVKKEDLLQQAEQSQNESKVKMAKFLRHVDREREEEGSPPIVFNRLLVDGTASGEVQLDSLCRFREVLSVQGVNTEGLYLEMSFDLDTLEVETPSLSPFFEVSLAVKRDGWSVRDEYQARTRGRHVVLSDNGRNFNVKSSLEVDVEERWRRTGYSCKRRIGCLQGSYKHPLFMYQTHTDLNTNSKRVAWEVVYEYVGWHLRGDGPERVARQSSSTSHKTRGEQFEGHVGTATMSSTQCEEFMNNIADLDCATLFFHNVYEDVLRECEARMMNRPNHQQGEEQEQHEQGSMGYDQLWALLHEGEHGVDDDDGDAAEWDDAVYQETQAYYLSMLKRLRFYGVFQLSRVGAGSIMVPMDIISEHGVDIQAYADEMDSIESDLLAHVGRLVDLRKVRRIPHLPSAMSESALDVSSTDVLLFPHVAMELRVVERHEGGQGWPQHSIFTAPVEGGGPPEPIRLHLNKREFKTETQRWKHALSGGQENPRRCPVRERSGYYSCWGNLAGNAGPTSYKGGLIQKSTHPPVDIAGIGMPDLPPLAWCVVPQPIPGRGPSTTPFSNTLCIYETTCRGVSEKKSLKQEASLVQKMQHLVDFQTTSAKKLDLLGQVVQEVVRWFSLSYEQHVAIPNP